MRRESRLPRLTGLLAGSLIVATGLLSAGAAGVLAQGETGVGVEVPYINDEGVTLGTIEVRQIQDFGDFSEEVQAIASSFPEMQPLSAGGG